MALWMVVLARLSTEPITWSSCRHRLSNRSGGQPPAGPSPHLLWLLVPSPAGFRTDRVVGKEEQGSGISCRRSRCARSLTRKTESVLEQRRR